MLRQPIQRSRTPSTRAPRLSDDRAPLVPPEIAGLVPGVEGKGEPAAAGVDRAQEDQVEGAAEAEHEEQSLHHRLPSASDDLPGARPVRQRPRGEIVRRRCVGALPGDEGLDLCQSLERLGPIPEALHGGAGCLAHVPTAHWEERHWKSSNQEMAH